MHCARAKGYQNVRRADIAKQAGVSDALVSRYLSTMVQIKRTIMRQAVHTSDLRIVAQGLAAGDKIAGKAPPELKSRAIAALAG